MNDMEPFRSNEEGLRHDLQCALKEIHKLEAQRDARIKPAYMAAGASASVLATTWLIAWSQGADVFLTLAVVTSITAFVWFGVLFVRSCMDS